MIYTIITSIIAYISTNIDDMFINMLFFAQAKNNRDNYAIVVGKYFGTGLLVLASCMGTYGLKSIAERHLCLLGLIPVGLGIKEIINNTKNTDAHNNNIDFSKGFVFSTAVITVANGADNIGVYLPLFSGFDGGQLLTMSAVFVCMTAIWCFLGKKLADLPLLHSLLNKYKKIIVPAVYIGLGVYIIAG